MPNRYEREIEEILRNLEQTEPKQSRGQRFGERLRRKPGPSARRPRRSFSLHLSPTDWLLAIALGAALLAGGYAFTAEPTIYTGILAGIGLLCLMLLAFSHFLFRSDRSQSVRYGNITITPLRRNPLNGLKTQWNLFLLRMRYRRKNKH